ncbi:alpha/beta hydrolase [Treponema socranskii]|jgi:hydrolase
MKSSIIYIHGNGGSAKEASHYQSFFTDADVIGFDYKAKSPWEAKKEFSPYFDSVFKDCKSVMIIANSIGAFFAMHALSDMPIETEKQMRFLDNWLQSFTGSNLSVK